MDDATFDLGGRSLAYLTGGTAPPTILLVHGGGDNAGTWHELAPALTAIGRVVAPDLAGHGRSDDPPPDGPIVFHDDLVRLLDGLGVDDTGPVLVVGHSLGSPVALTVAARRPVAGVLLLDGAPHRGMFATMPPFDADEYRQRMQAMGFGEVRTAAELDEFIRTNPHPEQIRRAHKQTADGHYAARPSLEETVRMAEKGRRTDNPYLDLALYTDVAVPTIALQATRGNQPDVRAEIDDLFRRNDLLEVRWLEATHSIHWDQPEEVVKAVRDLLNRTKASSLGTERRSSKPRGEARRAASERSPSDDASPS